MNPSDTPETDALIEPCHCGKPDCVIVAQFDLIDLARKLERERNAAIQSAKDNSANFRRSEVKRIEAERERDELKRKIGTDFMAGIVIELEAKISTLEAKLTALGDIAVSQWDDKVVGEVDATIPPEKQTKYADFLRSLFITTPAERDQLRKVCDTLAHEVKIWWEPAPEGAFHPDNPVGQICLALEDYNQLPHVKEKNK